MTDLDRDAVLKQEDAAARALARTTFDVPLLLEAGAGTGKTTTLIARLVTWSLGPGWTTAERELGSPTSAAIARRVLDGIVAITFTEAAAADMGQKLERAFRTLAARALPTGCADADLPKDEDARELRARALAQALDRPVVHTIHAFCRGLLAAHPFEAGLSPTFTVDADGSACEEIVRSVLEDEFAVRLADRPDAAIAQLFTPSIGPARIQDALATLSGKGCRAEDLRDDPYTPERADELVRDLVRRARAFLDGPGTALAQVSARSKVTSTVLDALRSTATAVPEARPLTLAHLEAAAERMRALWSTSLRKRIRDWSRGVLNDSERAALGDREAALEAAAASASGAIERFCRMRPVMQDSARRTLATLLERVRAQFVARGIETYSDLLRDARDLVARERRVVRALRAHVRQFVVDEFQDTDPLQCDLIRSLALDDLPDTVRPGLFLVGDPKQSIYGWRSADLAAYEGFAQEIEAHGGRRARLSINHRSTRRILNEVERAIAPVMRPLPGVQPQFQPLVAARVEDGEPVERWAPWIVDESSAHAFAATRAGVARDIEARWIASDLALRHARGALWGEMAILLRSTGHLDTYLAALRARAVPYSVTGDKSYYKRREIIEAAVLVRTVVDPRDHVALVALLRSSLVGVPDAALIPLWRHRFHEHVTEMQDADGAAHRSALAAVAHAARELPTDVPGIERLVDCEANLVAAVQAIAALRRSFATDPTDVFVERLRTLFLVEARAAALHLGTYRVSNLERFFLRLSETLDASASDAHSCLRALRVALAQTRAAEEARPKDAALDAVSVLTIHKSKGLDFAHVYVAGLNHGVRRTDVPACDVVAIGGRTAYAFFGSPSPGYEEVEALRARVEAAERVRTLYVAMTRARERLVLTGQVTDAHAAKPWDTCATHMELLAHSQPEDLVPRLCAGHAAATPTIDIEDVRWVLPTPLAAESVAPDRAPEQTYDARIDARHAAELARACAAAQLRMCMPWSIAATALAAADAAPRPAAPRIPDSVAADSLARDEASIVGRVVHGALEGLANTSDADLAIERGRAALARALAREPASALSIDAGARATALFERFVAGPLGARRLALARDVIACELPALLPPPADGRASGFVSAAIDLVYFDRATDEFVIADYKTDAAPSHEHAERYRSQGRVYQRALREALTLDRDPRFELWFLADERIEIVV